MRNFLYPAGIVIGIGIIWIVGWASSVEARANIGYWSPMNGRSAAQRLDDSSSDAEHKSAVAAIDNSPDSD